MPRPTVLLLLMLMAPTSTGTLPAQQPDHPKSGAVAFLLSLAGSSIPFAIAASTDGPNVIPIFAGLLVGPSLGHFYAGQPRRALITTGLRAGVLAITVIDINTRCDDDSGEGFFCGFGAAVIGSAALTALAIFDIVTAPVSARKYNREHLDVRVVSMRGGKQLRVGVGVRIPF